MKITLKINGEKKEFFTRGGLAGSSLMAYDLAEDYDKRKQAGELYTEEHREKLLRFVVELFGSQFTEQEFLEGFEDSFFALFPGIMIGVIEGLHSKLQAFPVTDPNPEAPETTE